MFVRGKLKKYRKMQNLTQKELADLSGVSISTVTKLESGVLKNPSPGVVARIAIVLHVYCSDLETSDVTEANPFTMIDNEGLEYLKNNGYVPETWQPSNRTLMDIEEYNQLNILLSEVRKLNEKGRFKVIEYAGDLFLNGSYARKDLPPPVPDEIELESIDNTLKNLKKDEVK